MACIMIRRKQHALGYYAKEDDAAAAYQKVKADPSQLAAVLADYRNAATYRKPGNPNWTRNE